MNSGDFCPHLADGVTNMDFVTSWLVECFLVAGMVEEVRVTQGSVPGKKIYQNSFLSLSLSPNLTFLDSQDYPRLMGMPLVSLHVLIHRYTYEHVHINMHYHEYKQSLRFFSFWFMWNEGRQGAQGCDPAGLASRSQRTWLHWGGHYRNRGTAHRTYGIQVCPRKHECLGRVRYIIIKEDLMSNKYGKCQVKPT